MACREGQKGLNPCAFFKNRDKTAKQQTWDPLDIEELHNYGKSHCGCPYYVMKDRS